MKHIIKFKSFKEANNYTIQEFCKNKLNLKKLDTFLKNYASHIKIPYKPGLYRFKSFEDARNYDMLLRIKSR